MSDIIFLVIKMNKPIIGIIGKSIKYNKEFLWHEITCYDEIRYLIVKNGGIAIEILPTEITLEFNDNDIHDNKILSKEELEDLYKQIDLCDGFVLQGGLCSCQYEIEIAKRVIELDKPLIGICAGFNNILRAIGTDVLLDKTDRHNHFDRDYRHLIKINKESMIYQFIQKEEIQVNSIHSMIATKEQVEPYAKITSYSEDGLVESIELPNKKFILGIKWHPELMFEEEYVDRIFTEFINKASEI